MEMPSALLAEGRNGRRRLRLLVATVRAGHEDLVLLAGWHQRGGSDGGLNDPAAWGLPEFSELPRDAAR